MENVRVAFTEAQMIQSSQYKQRNKKKTYSCLQGNDFKGKVLLLLIFLRAVLDKLKCLLSAGDAISQRIQATNISLSLSLMHFPKVK